MIEEAALAQILETSYVPVIARTLGDRGTRALRSLIPVIRRVYRTIDPTSSVGQITVFHRVGEAGEPPITEGARRLQSFDELVPFATAGFTLELDQLSDVYLLDSPIQSIETFSESALVYRYDAGDEYFLAGGLKASAPKLYPGPTSNFSVPYFRLLDEALAFYGNNLARECRCLILQTVWHDARRIYLKQKPERQMRRSLEQFLVSTLRSDADVRPEQPVDESHPVDIRVAFQFANRVALIEVKWLGKSVDESGAVTTDYSEGRAQEGADQLADYLERNRPYGASQITTGYLVVYDARRKGGDSSGTVISSEDARFYALAPLNFTTRHDLTRADFAPPVRFFLEPKIA